jgi:hypothetical protein
MGGDSEHPVVILLRQLDNKLDHMHRQLGELIERVNNVELAQGNISREMASLVESDAQVRASLDRLSDRPDWMELTD